MRSILAAPPPHTLLLNPRAMTSTFAATWAARARGPLNHASVPLGPHAPFELLFYPRVNVSPGSYRGMTAILADSPSTEQLNPGIACCGATYPIAVPRPRVGENDPLVMSPIRFSMNEIESPLLAT